MKIYNKSYCFQIIYSFTQTTYDKLMQNLFYKIIIIILEKKVDKIHIISNYVILFMI
jgi:hypothetical protein